MSSLKSCLILVLPIQIYSPNHIIFLGHRESSARDVVGTNEKQGTAGFVGKLRKMSNVMHNRRPSVNSSVGKLSIAPKRLESIMDENETAKRRSRSISEVIDVDRPDSCEVDLDFEVARL